jgi:hypothetical protein
MQILMQIKIEDQHKDTGNVRHTSDGRLLAIPRYLQIARMEDDSGYYLLYLDEKGKEQTDTWHESVEAALSQAEFEFGVQASEWTRIS